jgi:hypothetical protein
MPLPQVLTSSFGSHGGLRAVCSACGGAACAVLANLCALPSQPCSQYGKRRCRLRSTLSTIRRLPSGSPASRSGAFRDGVLGLRSRYCPWLHGRVGGTSAHPHSASDSSFGVVLRIHAHMRPHGLGRNTSHKPCTSPLPPSAQSRLSPESPAPWLMRLVRPRYMSGIPFPCCGASAPYSRAKRG